MCSGVDSWFEGTKNDYWYRMLVSVDDVQNVQTQERNTGSHTSPEMLLEAGRHGDLLWVYLAHSE